MISPNTPCVQWMNILIGALPINAAQRANPLVVSLIVDESSYQAIMRSLIVDFFEEVKRV